MKDPAVEPSHHPTAHALANFSRSFRPEFSPDGDEITFLSDRGGLPEIWQQPLQGAAKPRRLSDFPDPVQEIHWSPTGEWLAAQVAPGGGLNSQIHLLNAAGDETQQITPGGRSNHWLARWLPDGATVLFHSNQEDADTMHLYAHTWASGETRRITQQQAGRRGVSSCADIRCDGRAALLERVVSRSNQNVYLLDLVTGDETLLTEHEGPGAFHNARFSPAGDIAYLSADFERDKTAFCRIDLKSPASPGPIEVLRAFEDAVLLHFALSPQGTQAALCWSRGGRCTVEILDLPSQQATPIPLPTELALTLRYREDGRQLAIHCAAANLPGDIWLYDTESGDCQRCTHSPHEGIDPEALVKPRLVHFTAHDGLELSGWLYEAAAPQPGPTVIHFHGGPEGQALPSYRYDFQALLAQGINVFDPNVRGSAGFGKEFVNLDNGALRFNGRRDIESCVKFLRQEGIAAAGRLGIMGASYGGYMTMAGLAQYPELFAAGVNICGVVNFFTFFEQTEAWMAAISTVKYGDPATEPELLRELSPFFQLERVQSPTLVIHGANDTNVPVVEAEQVVAGLRERNIPCQYLLYPDEGHGLTRLANKIDATEAIVSWFQRYLDA
ncbi:MAG: S9 family peptidase [Chloroflexi bacterium]|nr:S9 family peptidase [Chloroflexota bacterium]